MPGFIPDDYVPDPGQRLELYKRLSAVVDDDELGAVMTEIADRYGPPPGEAVLLGELMGIKALARRIGALALEISAARVAIALPPDSPVRPAAPWRRLPDGRYATAPPGPASVVGARAPCYHLVNHMKTALTALVGIVLGYGLAVGCQNNKDERARPRPARRRGGSPSAPPQSAEELKAPLAKIDDVVITLGEFQERINRQSPYIRARYTSLEQKKEFLDSLVRFEILAKEAYRRGYDKDPEVIRTMKQVMIQKLMRDEFDTKVTADTVSDAEMKTYYDANVADYVKPEEVRVSAIILKNKAQADRVLLEAKGDAGKTNKGFRDLVTKYSADEETKLRGGDLRYIDETNKDLPAARDQGGVHADEYRGRQRRRRCRQRPVLHPQADRPPQGDDEDVRRREAADPQQAVPREAAAGPEGLHR